MRLEKITVIVRKKSDGADPENGEREAADTRIQLEKIAVLDDSEEVAERGDEGEHASGDEEAVDPVAHDWRHAARSRVQPQRKRKSGQEETGHGDEKDSVLLFVSFNEPTIFN